MRLSNAIFLVSVLLAIACAAVAVRAEDATGCCLNAKTIVCLLPVTQAQCCPDNPTAYGIEGAPDQQACVERYFKPGVDCTRVDNCTIGCCCNPLPLRRVEPACKKGIWTNDSQMQGPCDRDYCERYNASFPQEPLPDYIDPSVCPDPAPFVLASPRKGQKLVDLSFSAPNCGYRPKFYRIERKEIGTLGHQEIVKDYVGLSYVDNGSILKWGKEYQYNVTATYLLSGNRNVDFSRRVNIKLGDTLCWGVFDSRPFCVAPNYFTLVSSERPSFSYYFQNILGITPANLRAWINTTFSSYFFNSYTCNASNKAHLNRNCSATGKTCVIDSTYQPQCYARGPCEGVQPFGMFTTSEDQCETKNGEPKYCFYDKSQTLVNKCYDCNPLMDCYDYKSEEACEANNCRAAGVLDCNWNWTNQALGMGVCVTKGRDNCKYCESQGTSAVQSLDAHNFIFNRCSQEKRNALEVENFPCGPGGLTCRDFTCEGVTLQTDCAAAIELGNSNQITTGSSLCDGGIRACAQAPTKTHCVKDANGDGSPDCGETDLACQRDRYPPHSTLASTVWLFTNDNITFSVLDKTESQGVERPVSLGRGYQLLLCSYTGSTECGTFGYKGINSDPGSYFNMTKASMKVEDLISQGKLSLGDNTIKYFAVDPSKNVEVINTANIKLSTHNIGGIGIFLYYPGNNSYINYTTPKFRIYVDSFERINSIILKDINGAVVKQFYVYTTGSPPLKSMTREETINLPNIQGWKEFTIEVVAENLPARQSRIRVYLDTEHPAKPILNAIPSYTDTNRLKLSGTAEAGTTLKVYLKLGSGPYEQVATALVNSANKFNLSSTPIILHAQGDYKVFVRAYDLAENPSPDSDIQSFTFVSGAPTFDVIPPEGAVRAIVRNVTVFFHPVSEFVTLNRNSTGSKIQLFWESLNVSGTLVWKDSTTLVFRPSSLMSDGRYTAKITSIDTRGNKLQEFSSFRVERQAPRIVVASWPRNTFKVRLQQQEASGYIEDTGSNVTLAFISIRSTPPYTYIIPPGRGHNVPFTKYVYLIDGMNRVVFNATNRLGATAIEPYEIILDRTPPVAPVIGLR